MRHICTVKDGGIFYRIGGYCKMKLQQLYYFKALAEKEHLFQTATELYISAPALSAAISRLEEDLGVSLFDRVGRNIRLNENGKKFYVHVNKIIDELERACLELKNDKPANPCMLTVYTSNNISWGDALEEFIVRNPYIIFNHQVMNPDKLFRGAAPQQQPDFIITALSDVPSAGYEYSVLLPDDSPVLCVYPGHRFCERTSISLREACQEPFIMPAKTYSIRGYFDKLCEMAGFTPNVVAEADAQLRSRLVKSRMGITITTKLSVKAPVYEGLPCIDITEPKFPRVQAIIWREDKEQTPQGKAFLNFMLDYYKDFR